MLLRILGAHQGESRDIRFISMLIDGRLAIDAGGLTTSLSLEEQRGIQALLITHWHFDHIKDLPMLAHNLWEYRNLDVYCTQEVRDVIMKHLFNNVVWPDVTREQEGFFPVLFHTIEPDLDFDLLGYTIRPARMPHTVPTVGYSVESGGRRIYYTADTRGTGDAAWSYLRPDLLVVETTMANSADADAARFKHLTPVTLGKELRAFRDREGYIPQTICVHINPKHEQAVHRELAALAVELGADIVPGYEGMQIEV